MKVMKDYEVEREKGGEKKKGEVQREEAKTAREQEQT